AIAERGALLSEMSDQTPPTPPRFLLRNRIVAAISRLVWVVQAPARSGALSTARIGDRLGRPIFATPASPWDPRGAGNVELLAEGALAMGGVEAILGHLQLEPGTKPEERREPRDSTPPELREIVEALGKEPTHPDVLARRLDRSAASIQRDLLELLLLGRVMERAGGYIALPR
ncbi:MAG: DNA-processing protein DprA, partial [Myxococcales bacterium]|nr:DNA-processing protein DprA [Myxococcales bacterium]